MPMFAGERDAAAADDAICGPGDFAPTPLHLPGGLVLDTRDMLATLGRAAPPVVLDVGRGLDTGRQWLRADQAFSPEEIMAFSEQIARQHRAAGIVVVGNGVSGCLAYTVARHLVDIGLPNVMWYRGGEEAWHKHAIAGAMIAAYSPARSLHSR